MSSYILDPAATPQPTTTGVVAMSPNGLWLAYTDASVSRTLYVAKKIAGVWTLFWTSISTFLNTAARADMRFSYDGSKLAILPAGTAGVQLFSFDNSTGVCTADTITTGTPSAVYQVMRWHPTALILSFSGVSSGAFSHLLSWNGTQWNTLGTDVTDVQHRMEFNAAGTLIIKVAQSGANSNVYAFSTSTGIGTALTTPFDTAPGANLAIDRWVQGSAEGFIVGKSTTPFMYSFLWNAAAVSGQGQYQTKSCAVAPSGTAVSRQIIIDNGKRALIAEAATPYFASIDISSGGVVTASANQPDRTGVSALPTSFASIPTGNEVIVAATNGTDKLLTYSFSYSHIASMVGLLPTSAANVTGINIEQGVFVGLIAQMEALVDVVSGIQSTGEMVGLMPTTAAAVATTKAVTAAMVGYLPESAGAVKIVEHVSGDMVGYLPNSSAAVEASMHFVAAMSGYLPESAADIMIPIDMSAQMVGLLPTGTGSVLVGSGYGLDSAMVGLLPSSVSDVLITIPPYAATAAMVGYLPETAGAVLMTDERTMSAAMEGYLPETTADVFHEPPYDISVDMSGYMPTSSTLLGYVAPAGTDKLADIRANLALKGRKVTFVKRHDVIDAANPMGPTLGTLETISDVPAVFVYPSGLVHLGLSKLKKEMFNECEKICMVTTPETGEDLSTFDYVVDQDINWEIVTSEALQPGFIKLLYYIGMKRS